MSGFDRAVALDRLASEEFDVLVVGGGITGCGVALDAATRGLRTALVERDDFASGTSSKSSKLVHGGLRYLQQKEIRLVYDALHERQRALRNAPHLVRVLPFLIPVLSRDGLINPKIARALGSALWMYDLTGGARIRSCTSASTSRPRWRTCPPCASRTSPPRTSTTTRRPTTHASRSCSAAPRPRTARSSRTTAVSPGFTKDPAGRVTGATVPPTVASSRFAPRPW